MALQDDVDLAEVIGSANDAAFVAVIASEQPQAVSPRIVHDVVHVADRTLMKRIGDIPRRAAISRSVDVNFIARRVVKIFSPENSAAGNWRDVQRPRAPSNFVAYLEAAFVVTKSDDRSRHRCHNAI